MIECTPIEVFCCPMTLFIIKPPYIIHTPPVAENLPTKPLVARQWPRNCNTEYNTLFRLPSYTLDGSSLVSLCALITLPLFVL